jgi:hypothetical protein
MHTQIFFMMFFFRVLVPCRLVGRCQRFGETYCLHLQGRSAKLGSGGRPWKGPIPSLPNSLPSAPPQSPAWRPRLGPPGPFSPSFQNGPLPQPSLSAKRGMHIPMLILSPTRGSTPRQTGRLTWHSSLDVEMLVVENGMDKNIREQTTQRITELFERVHSNRRTSKS